MSLPVKDRKMRVFQHVAGKQQQQTIIEEDSLEDNEKEALSQFNSELKKLIMGLDNQQFQSKSKQDYQKLLKEPLYTKTTIRIKFPENIILEGLFSPMETVQSIIDFVGQNLETPEQPFYIFQSPPRQIMDKRFTNKTLFELECLPGANFYFGTDDPEYAKKKSYLTSKLMEPFTQKDKIEEEIVC